MGAGHVKTGGIRLKHSSGHGKPASFLVENVDLIPGKRVLDVAMGKGRNAIFLAKAGFDVEGVDISEEAVKDAVALAKKEGVSIKAVVANLEGNYRIEEESYDAIICFNYLQRSLFDQIKRGLRGGGVVIYETFIVDQVKFGRPRNPDYLLRYNELLDVFRDFRCLRYREGIIENRKASAAIVAQKINREKQTDKF